MPQIQARSILVGNRIVGSMTVDGGSVLGEGGPLHPQLAVSLTIKMDGRPADSMLAVVWLRASLFTDQAATPSCLVCQPVAKALIDSLPARSGASKSRDVTVQLHFFVAATEVEALERHRHAVGSELLTLYLGLEAIVAGVIRHNQGILGPPQEQTQWDELGEFTELLPFWQTQIEPLPLFVEKSTWVREVLPNLGYDRARLLEVQFPPPLPDHASAASEWDKARRALDEHRYGDCISECRDLLAMWQTQFGATSKRPIATVIAQSLGWQQDDVRVKFFDSAWKAAVDLVNVPHHPEGQPRDEHFYAADARLMLMVTAALSEFVSASLR